MPHAWAWYFKVACSNAQFFLGFPMPCILFTLPYEIIRFLFILQKQEEMEQLEVERQEFLEELKKREEMEEEQRLIALQQAMAAKAAEEVERQKSPEVSEKIEVNEGNEEVTNPEIGMKFSH